MSHTATHPGEQLAEQLSDLDMSAAELGRQLKVPANRITEILNKQRAITGDTALRLGYWFGMNPQFWLNLRSPHDVWFTELNQARKCANCQSRRHDRNATASL